MAKKFGTFKGVFVPSTEAILGTVLFLLLPALTADVGLVHMLAIIIVAHSVTISTSFSIADCATNLNKIGGGGMYALSRRSLGRALGGSIGVQLYIAQAASIGFYCIGFAEPLQPILLPLLKDFALFAGTAPADILFQKQVLASAVFFIFFIIVIIGADFTLKIQMIILFVLIGSVSAILLSPLFNITYEAQPLFSNSIQGINLWGNRGVTIAVFFMTFTQFFPAVTGIDAGVGMSGELKNAKRSLVRGTFSAIFITFLVYLLTAAVFSLMDKNLLITGYSEGSPAGVILTDLLGFRLAFPDSLMGIMILLGILLATSSSALSCFMTAPRTAQSMTIDGTLPGFLNFLGKDFKKGGAEPRYSTLFTAFISFSIIWMGSINVAAMIVGICFLVVYGWVNGAAFLERISGNPTFRPTFNGHWAVSLYGFLSSLTAIVLFSWKIGVLVIVTQYIIFKLLLKYRAQGKLEGVWWGVFFTLITRGLSSLNRIVQGTKNWRPILTAIAFSGKGNFPEKILYLADVIASYKGLVSNNVITSGDPVPMPDVMTSYKSIITNHPTETIMSMVQMSHHGNIKPNTVLLEFARAVDSTKIINKILDLNQNMLLLKNGEKLERPDKIDLWWRGEKNGNFMVLLAYMITSYNKKVDNQIRIIRKLDQGEDTEKANKEMIKLLERARLDGEIVILPYSEEPLIETLKQNSNSSDLIMMGIPGNYIEKGGGSFFNLNEFFFDKEIQKYEEFPPILFVKSAYVMDLIED